MLSNLQLHDLAKYYEVPLAGIYLRDQLPAKGPSPGLSIVNLDDSKPDFPYGTHWTALWCDGSESIYFDSFGCLPCPEVQKWSKRKSKGGLHYNAWICQSLNTECCGWYCLAFGLFISREDAGEPLVTCVNRFVNLFENNTSRNESRLFQYIKSVKPIPHGFQTKSK